MRTSALQPGLPRSRYQRHQPENTAFYPIVEQNVPALREALQQHEASLPGFVLAEFEDYLRCGLLEHGFIRVKCNGCRHEHLVAFSCKRRGFCPSCGARRKNPQAVQYRTCCSIKPLPGLSAWIFTRCILRVAFSRARKHRMLSSHHPARRPCTHAHSCTPPEFVPYLCSRNCSPNSNPAQPRPRPPKQRPREGGRGRLSRVLEQQFQSRLRRRWRPLQP